MYENPRIPTPAGLATATPDQVFDALALNINDKDVGESTQRNFIVRVLAALGYASAPEILTSMLDGSRVRLYHWKDTPAGDIILVTGPSFRGQLVRPSELVERDDGFYLRATPDTSKAASAVEKAAASGRAEAQRASDAMRGAEARASAATQRKAAREERAARPRPAAKPPAMAAAIKVPPHVETAAAAAPPRPRKPRAAPAAVAPAAVEQTDEEAAAGLAAKMEALFA